MHIPPELLPVIQITAPLIVSIFLATAYAVWSQNQRIDDLRADLNGLRGDLTSLRSDMNRQFEQVHAGLHALRLPPAVPGEANHDFPLSRLRMDGKK